jgi:hypothetical protein
MNLSVTLTRSIHPSAWKVHSRKFASWAFYTVRAQTGAGGIPTSEPAAPYSAKVLDHDHHPPLAHRAHVLMEHRLLFGDIEHLISSLAAQTIHPRFIVVCYCGT